MCRLLLISILFFSYLSFAKTTINFNVQLSNKDLSSAIDEVLKEVKLGQADVKITYSTSMGIQSLWVEADYLQDSKATEFIKFYERNNMNFFITVKENQ